MKRSVAVPPWLVLGGLILGLVLAIGSARTAVAWWLDRRVGGADPLDWVEREFHPSSQQKAALRDIHQRYAPLRGAMARDLARQRDLLIAQATEASAASPAFRAAAQEWDRLAAQSHDLTWRYVFEISAQLPPAEARRFRGEMARSVLGLSPGDLP